MRALVFVSVLLIVALALPRFISGLAYDTAFPIPAGMAANRIYSKEVYAKTAAVLALADSDDGETQIARAEAAWRAGAPPHLIQPIIERALAHSPASIQGWTLLSEVAQLRDRAKGTAALTISLELSPYDYWLIGRKSRAGAPLWDALSPDSRDMLLRQARLLWKNESLRSEIEPLLAVKGGPQLMTRAIADDEIIRALNRMVARKRLGLSP